MAKKKKESRLNEKIRDKVIVVKSGKVSTVSSGFTINMKLGKLLEPGVSCTN